MTKVIIDDLKKLKKEYSVPRKTTIDNVEEAVIVKKADLTVNFIKVRHHDFYERLVSKLAHWATPADDLHNDVE